MDKKLLDALNNLSVALEDIADILAKKQSTSSTGAALESGDLSKNLKEIDAGIKSIKADTQEILKGQKTILEMSRKNSTDKKKTPMEEIGGDKKQESNLKKGLGTILLIAVAVLAIGLAFKLVGKIDFLSVISLGLAIMLISVAFEKVAKLNLSLKQAALASAAMVLMALAVTASSWVLSMIKPIGFMQTVTGILIAGMFYVIANHMENIFIGVAAFDKLRVSPVKLVTSLVAISTAITFSSWILSFIRPMSLGQSVTAILIAGMFAVIGFSFHKIAMGVAAFKLANVKTTDLLLVLVGISAAITASSYILSLIKPMGFWQAVTGIMISLMFLAISFNLEKIAIGIVAFKRTGVKATDLLLVLVGIAGAITASSWILSFVMPIGIWQFLTALGIVILFAVMSYFMDKLAIGIVLVEKFLGKGKIFLIPLVMVAISLAIMLSSHILEKTADIKFMTLLKVLALGLILALVVTAFVPAMVILGLVGIKNLLTGGLGIVIMATALAISSQILALGNYGNYPNWKWALGVGLSMIAFVPAVLALGLISMSGVGALALLAGAAAVLGVAGTIVATSHILSFGKYTGGPPLWWSMSTALSLTAFTAGMVLLGGMIVASFGLGALALAAGSKAVLTVAQTIVDTSFILQKGKYVGGPTKEWAEGISLALGAFSPVYGMLMANKILSLFGGGGVGPEDFAKAIKTISMGIVDAANFFNGPEAKAAFIGGPKKEWAEGVGKAIGAFAPVYQVLADNSGWFSSGVSVEDMAKAIMTISRGIVDAATFFNSPENTGVFDVSRVPSKEWADGVGGALGAFSPIFNALSKDTGWFTSGKDVVDNMLYGITSISTGIVRSAIILARGERFFKTTIDPNFVKKLSSNIIDYMTLVDKLSKYKTSSIKSLLGMDPVENIANGMVKIAGAYDRLARAIRNFSTALNGMDAVKVNSFTRLTGNLALLSAMDSTMFSNMLKVIESRSGVFANLLKVQGAELGKRPGVNVGGPSGAPAGAQSKKDEQIKDAKGETQLQKLDKIYKVMVEMTGYTKSIDEHLQKPGTKKNEDIGAKGDD